MVIKLFRFHANFGWRDSLVAVHRSRFYRTEGYRSNLHMIKELRDKLTPIKKPLEERDYSVNEVDVPRPLIKTLRDNPTLAKKYLEERDCFVNDVDMSKYRIPRRLMKLKLKMDKIEPENLDTLETYSMRIQYLAKHSVLSQYLRYNVSFFQLKPVSKAQLDKLEIEFNQEFTGKSQRLQDDLLGKLSISREGINVSISSPLIHVLKLVHGWFEGRGFDNMTMTPVNATLLCNYRFLRMKRVRSLLSSDSIHVGIKENATNYVHSVQEWNKLVGNPDTLVLDVRNNREINLGSFPNSTSPETDCFSKFPSFVTNTLPSLVDNNKHKHIAMFCTGGIRCEKAGPYIKSLGYENVYQLKGGIIRYQNNCVKLTPDNRDGINQSTNKTPSNEPIKSEDESTWLPYPSHVKHSTCNREGVQMSFNGINFLFDGRGSMEDDVMRIEVAYLIKYFDTHVDLHLGNYGKQANVDRYLRRIVSNILLPTTYELFNCASDELYGSDYQSRYKKYLAGHSTEHRILRFNKVFSFFDDKKEHRYAERDRGFNTPYLLWKYTSLFGHDFEKLKKRYVNLVQFLNIPAFNKGRIPRTLATTLQHHNYQHFVKVARSVSDMCSSRDIASECEYGSDRDDVCTSITIENPFISLYEWRSTLQSKNATAIKRCKEDENDENDENGLSSNFDLLTLHPNTSGVIAYYIFRAFKKPSYKNTEHDGRDSIRDMALQPSKITNDRHFLTDFVGSGGVGSGGCDMDTFMQDVELRFFNRPRMLTN